MISYVRGKLIQISEGSIILETGGIGIRIYVPSSVSLPGIGEEVKLNTYFKVAEDSMSLYGFNTPGDLSVFEMLIGVSGIGPKGALALLSALSPGELRSAVINGDVKLISSAPGIGAKTAQRVIIDLRDKLTNSELFLSSGRMDDGAASGAKQEAAEALTALGYRASDVNVCLAGLEITDDMTTETIIKLALRRI